MDNNVTDRIIQFHPENQECNDYPRLLQNITLKIQHIEKISFTKVFNQFCRF